MREIKNSFTTEKPIDYTSSKDAYDGTLNSIKPEQSDSDKNQENTQRAKNKNNHQ